MKKNQLIHWFFLFVKGMFIGSGAILPGVSGGALAAVFGIYERMISFLSDIRKNFKENVIFFTPIGLGCVFGIFLLSFAISFFFEKAEVQIIWFFIGCIVGTIPALIKEAGKKGRKPIHILITIGAALLIFFILFAGDSVISGALPLNFFTWILAGALVGLGGVVPGLSPSNFLVYLDLYKPMTEGIKTLDLAVIIPLGLGFALVLFGLSKIMNLIFKRSYAALFHFILGSVFASTLMIIPLNYNYLSMGGLYCLIVCFLGILLGLWMGRLEERYKPKDDEFSPVNH
ncbi:MAG: DUF368 domain-containing protein [Methanosarcinales archaeon]|nr:DUF368 domain-containing protein [Methanosarcinales archaeon]